MADQSATLLFPFAAVPSEDEGRADAALATFFVVFRANQRGFAVCGERYARALLRFDAGARATGHELLADLFPFGAVAFEHPGSAVVFIVFARVLGTTDDRHVAVLPTTPHCDPAVRRRCLRDLQASPAAST